MRSNKSIWFFRAKRLRITKSGTLTVEDARKICPHTEKKIFQSGARRVVKRMLRKKRRNLSWEVLYE